MKVTHYADIDMLFYEESETIYKLLDTLLHPPEPYFVSSNKVIVFDEFLDNKYLRIRYIGKIGGIRHVHVDTFIYRDIDGYSEIVYIPKYPKFDLNCIRIYLKIRPISDFDNLLRDVDTLFYYMKNAYEYAKKLNSSTYVYLKNYIHRLSTHIQHY